MRYELAKARAKTRITVNRGDPDPTEKLNDELDEDEELDATALDEEAVLEAA